MEKNPVDIKAFNLHKSHTFSSFTHSSSHKISSWFTALNERRKKSAMKSSKNLTLGTNRLSTTVGRFSIPFVYVFLIFLGVLHENPLPSNSVSTEPDRIEDKHSPVKLRTKTKRIAEVSAFVASLFIKLLY